MSRSPSPVSSLDFGASDSEDEYAPQRRRKAALVTANKKKGQAPPPTTGGGKINLTALQRARAAETGDGGEYSDGGADAFLDTVGGDWGIDLSRESLKADHASRPLWIDEDGNM
jgi:hypothetical protein